MADISDAEMKEFLQVFQAIDLDGNGSVTAHEISQCMSQLKINKTHDEIVAMIADVDTNNSGTVDFDEFCTIMVKAKLNSSDEKSGFVQFAKASKELIKVKGASGMHSFAQEELSAFSNHFNNCLKEDADLKHLLPIESESLDLLRKVRDGLLLCKFINVAVADTIDVRALNRRKADKDLSLFQVNENQNVCISAAKSLGISVVNVGAGELIDGEKSPHLVLGLVWQLVKLQLLNSINLKNHPELVRLLEDGEELADLLKLPPDQLLLRWFNYHLKNAGHAPISNFGKDVHDSEAYTVLLHQIAPDTCDTSAMAMSDLTQRAQRVLDNGERLNVHGFIKPSDIVSGNKRLNLAFTAAIFNQCPGLDQLTQEELDKVGLMDDDVGDSREERAFRMWMNSLGIPEFYVNSLFEDCKDGLALLQVMDRIEPGIVSWKQVERKPTNRFKKVANCNYVVVLGKQMRFSLVGIGGIDIVDGNKKLLLALVWQLMRHHTLKFLKETMAQKFGTDEKVDDSRILKWANDTVAAKNRSTRMSSFKDKTLSTSHFFMDLLWAIEPRIIDWDLVTAGETEEDRILNARYAISVARKLNCTIFLLPEDIVEVQPKMIMTFVASIMAMSV
jgi:plastin-1